MIPAELASTSNYMLWTFDFEGEQGFFFWSVQRENPISFVDNNSEPKQQSEAISTSNINRQTLDEVFA